LKTKWKAKERPKAAHPTRTKKVRELVPPMEGSYPSHNP
jgi:hypothetical protein